VITYAELARRAGSPGAARAVGSAMAANPLPVVIPCHRVVRSDGGAGDYSAGGTAVKRRMLRTEGALPPRA
jgi:methylated-DNA-[protein]-cysteine S-methyltransferase